MAIFVGGVEITAGDLQVGGNVVQEVYVGSQLVFQNTPPTASVVTIQTVNAQTGNVTVTDQGPDTLFVAVSVRHAANSTAILTYTTSLGGVPGNTQDQGDRFQIGINPFTDSTVIITTWRAGTVPNGAQSLVCTPSTGTGNIGTVQQFFTITNASQSNAGIPITDGNLLASAHSVLMPAAANTLCIGCGTTNASLSTQDAPTGLTAGLVASNQGSVGGGVGGSYAMTMASTASLNQTLAATLTINGGSAASVSILAMLAIPGV